VVEESVHACSNCEPLANVETSDSFVTASSKRSLAESRAEGLRPRETMLGYANEAKRYGSGMRRAVSASGSSSHDL
jgi:hypothetical protein